MTLDQFEEHVASDERLRGDLIRMRGGCTCFRSPPCGNCTEPMTREEAERLGWEPPDERPPLHRIMEGWR